MLKLTTLEDWRPVLGERNWEKQTYSAFELAKKWWSGRWPAEVARVLATGADSSLRGLRIRHAIAEKPVFLETSKAPSMTDLMIYCRTPANENVVVEGKSRETFAQPIRDWVREGRLQPKPTRLRRLTFLNNTLGSNFTESSPIRYQLLHRTASVFLEAGLTGATAGIVLIHSFTADDGTNWRDFKEFVRELGGTDAKKNQLIGPISGKSKPNIRLFMGWVSDSPS
jgi:hypothetical protein